MFFKSTKVIGLDIGTSFIKVAELELSRRGASLVSFGIAATPMGAISARGEIVDPGTIAMVLQNLIHGAKTKRKAVAVGMWGSSVMVKKVTAPRMSEGDLSANIRFEAEQYIPFDINSINLDFVILKQNTSAETMDYLLIAAQREYLLKIAEVVETADLQCSIVDISSFSLANCYQFNYGFEPGSIIGLLNIGAGVTNFTVISNGDVVFARDLPVGGLTITTEIHKQLGVSLEEAEALKISASTGQNAPQEVTQILRSSTETLIEEIHRGFDFFSATTNDLLVQRVYISGGSSLLPGFGESLKNVLSMSVEPFNAFANVSFNSKMMTAEYISQISPYATIAMGLAMRKVGDR